MAIISLCVITKNQEKLLEACLNFGRTIADEMIVVDLQSTDSTKALAKKFTDKVFDFKWKDNFADARNFAIKKAKGDWILMLDANEKISPKFVGQIRKLIEDPDYDAFSFNQKTFTHHTERFGFVQQAHLTYPGYVEAPVVKLFRNKKNIKYQYALFETVLPSLLEQGNRIKNSNIPLFHYETDTERPATKGAYVRTILKKQLGNMPQDPKAHYDYATELLAQKSFPSALSHFKQAELLNKKQLISKARLNYALGTTSFLLQKYQDAITYLKQGLKANPNDLLSYVMLGRVLIFAKQYADVLGVIATAKEHAIVHPELLNMAGFSFLQLREHKQGLQTLLYAKKVAEEQADYAQLELITNNIITALIEIGNATKAIDLLEDAIKKTPHVGSYYFNLIQLFERQQTPEGLKAALKYTKKAKKQLASALPAPFLAMI